MTPRYHGKCLKIARGKVKDDEKYTCPICDHRVKIPRDAARPRLEDLQAWQDEIPNLPFRPDEEEILGKIIDNAQEFRQHISPFCNPVMATAEEAETQRFYLRKIEGAEILLGYETNFFRQELHKWSPVAPEAPPVMMVSKSTRKPRPTKLQKLLAQHGVDDPEELPSSVKIKPHAFKRKSTEPQTGRPQNLQPAPGRSNSGTPTLHNFPVVRTMSQSHPTHPSHAGQSNHSNHPSHSSSSLMQDNTGHAHPGQYGGYGSSQNGQYAMSPREDQREKFAPQAYMHSGQMHDSGYDNPPSPRQISGSIYSDRGFGSMGNAAIGGSVDSPSFGASQPMGGILGGGHEVSQMFDDLTNSDGMGMTDSQLTDPQLTDPQLTDPQLTDPQLTDPQLTDPQLTDPQLMDPRLTDPQLTDPQLTDPQLTDPQLTESQKAKDSQTDSMEDSKWATADDMDLFFEGP